MLKLFRRMFAAGPAAADAQALERWAQSRGHSFRHARDSQGCVIESQPGIPAWRIEWGASQRHYIEGFELRLIAELGLPKDLMAMVLNRSLMAAMEKNVYDQYVDDVQTRIDTDTPPEMRWLVMYPKLGAQDMGALRERYGAVSSVPPWTAQWLSGALSDALVATVEVVRSDQPVALTIGRGRLTLRTELQQPDATKLAIWFSVFEQAMRTARSVGAEWREAKAGDQATQPAAWANGDTVRQPEPGDPA